MELLQIFLIALAMSVDAFSVALGVGCGRTNIWSCLRLAAAFGLFQFLMPLLGAALGQAIGAHFAYTHYIAAGILFIIAFKMAKDAYKSEGVECIVDDPTLSLRLIVLALATSIDAFGVGIPLSLMQTSIWLSAAVIGLVCFVATGIGFFAGRAVAGLFKNAEYLGAAVLLGIGIKMLLI